MFDNIFHLNVVCKLKVLLIITLVISIYNNDLLANYIGVISNK